MTDLADDAFVDRIRDFRRDMLQKRTRWIEDRAGDRGPGNCRACLDGVMDCIDTVDRIYNECIWEGLSMSYCLDLWSSLFDICESQADQCFVDCGLRG